MHRYGNNDMGRGAAPVSGHAGRGCGAAGQGRDAGRRLAALLLGGLLAVPAAAADNEALVQELRRLAERVGRLEARNAELERRTAGHDAAHLEERLQAVETLGLGAMEQARMIEALEGINAGVSLTAVAQRAAGGATPDGQDASQLNYRGDAYVSLPGGSIGEARGNLFFHVRLGQGEGLAQLPPTFSAPNATAFRLDGQGRDGAGAHLAQAWYQLDVPLDGPLDTAKEHLEITLGKIDPYVYFDQNAAADDETTRFLNLAFVHNPLLDAGGGAGVDAYGFAPGLRLAYGNDQYHPLGWSVSLGAFGAGRGAAFEDSLSKPFVIAQGEVRQRLLDGLEGAYRLYAWRNGRATPYNNALDGATETQAGWGLSFDQKLASDLTLWGRYGQGVQGRWQFDRALTLGAELGGARWGRVDDGLGLGLGRLYASKDFKAVSASLDADGDGQADFGWRAAGAEQVAELYYRWQLNPQFALSPDYQFIRRPGADAGAADVHVLRVRAQVTF